jgi:hypothetical protein
MLRGALAEVRKEVPPFTGPALLAGVGATLVLIVVMLVSPAAGVAGGLMVFSFFLLALASLPARAAWEEGTVWRDGESGRTQFTVQALNAAAALAFLICAAASAAWAFGADWAAAAVTFAICLAVLALIGHHFRDTDWFEQTRRAYGHIGWVPKLVLATVWLIALAPEAISAYDHEDIRSGRVWEPAIRTIVAILPLGWFLWESGVLRSTRAEERPPLEPRGAQ